MDESRSSYCADGNYAPVLPRHWRPAMPRLWGRCFRSATSTTDRFGKLWFREEWLAQTKPQRQTAKGDGLRSVHGALLHGDFGIVTGIKHLRVAGATARMNKRLQRLHSALVWRDGRWLRVRESFLPGDADPRSRRHLGCSTASCHFLSRPLFRLHNWAHPIVKKHGGSAPSSNAFMALEVRAESGIVAHLPKGTRHTWRRRAIGRTGRMARTSGRTARSPCAARKSTISRTSTSIFRARP